MKETITSYLRLAAEVFIETGGDFLSLSLFYLLPIVALCILLLSIGRWMNRRLASSFGWRGILALSWLGTPVHEFSHIVGCWIGRHKITDFALLKPDPKTGSLGYVEHSYDDRSFYQSIIGNTLISLAPFVGGSLAITFITQEAFPELLSIAERMAHADIKSIGSFGDFTRIGTDWLGQMKRFFEILFTTDNLSTWRFWLYLYAMLSLAAYVSPSKSDFEGFWWPVVIVLCSIFLLLLAARLIGHNSWIDPSILLNASQNLTALLWLSLCFLIFGAAAVGAITLLWNMATKRSTN